MQHEERLGIDLLKLLGEKLSHTWVRGNWLAFLKENSNLMAKEIDCTKSERETDEVSWGGSKEGERERNKRKMEEQEGRNWVYMGRGEIKTNDNIDGMLSNAARRATRNRPIEA